MTIRDLLPSLQSSPHSMHLISEDATYIGRDLLIKWLGFSLLVALMRREQGS